MSNSDLIQRFIFDDLDVRGMVAGLESSYQDALKYHNYPPVIRRHLGEMMAAAALLSTSLKFEGRLSLQAQGTGAVRLLMAEITDKRELRAIARFDHELPTSMAFNELLVDGQMAITIEPTQGQRYQGVVPLQGKTLAACLESYFVQSEQLPTLIRLAADDTHAAGFMVQVMPSQLTKDTDGWERIEQLAATLKNEELISLDNQELLYRLYHEEDCRVYEGQTIQFKCDCSRERCANSLCFMEQEELEQILAEDGCVEVSCQFCNQSYQFDEIDIKTLGSERARIGGAKSALH